MYAIRSYYENRALAQDIGANPDLARDFVRVKASIAPLPQALSVVVAQRLQVVQVAPEQGNENLVGVDFGLHPEFMNSIKRRITSYNVCYTKLLRVGFFSAGVFASW